MNKIKKNEFGFSVVELVLVIVVIGLLGIVGWYVYKNQHKTTASSTTITSDYTLVKSSDGKISLRLPNDWQITKDVRSTMALGPDTSESSGCLGVDDPNQCLYMADFTPKSYQKGSGYGNVPNSAADENDYWILKIENLHGTTANTISFDQPNLIAQNDNSVNGYTAHYVKGYYGYGKLPQSNQSGMVYYDIQHAGYLAEFEENLTPNTTETNPYTLNSTTDAEFTKIAQSIRFNF